MILCLLLESEKNVTDLVEAVGINQTAVSNHLAKLRSAGAGMYEYRKLDAEAETAFRQAIRLCPTSPEANFRLADMLAARQRLDEAIAVMENLQAVCPPEQAERAASYLQQLKNKRNPKPDEPATASPATEP